MKRNLVFLVMMLSLVGVVSALNTTNTLSISGNAIAVESSLRYNQSFPNSADLEASLIDSSTTNEGRVHIQFDEPFTLGNLDSISWMQYVTTGYIVHIDVLIDTDEDGSADDALVFEYDKVKTPSDELVEDMDYSRNKWVNTFDDKGIVNGDAIGWLSSACSGNIVSPYFIHGSLNDIKTTGLMRSYKNCDGTLGDGAIINGETKITAIEIEVDGWIKESEAFIDDVKINNQLIEDFDPSSQQDVNGNVEDNIIFSVNPNLLSFGNIPFGNSVVDNGPNVTIDSTGSSTAGITNLQVEVEVTKDTSTFFKDLMQFFDGDSWEKVNDVLLMIQAGTSKDFQTRLIGDTASFGAGTKTATLTYTITGAVP